MEHILNLKQVAKKTGPPNTRYYWRLLSAMDGASTALTVDELVELESLLKEEHKKTIDHIKGLRSGQGKVKTKKK